jgi:hypothetical protein
MAKPTTKHASAALKLAPDGLPVFECRRDGNTRSMSFVCPKCKGRNGHSFELGHPGAADGHRASPCHCWPVGYYVREILQPKGGRSHG